MRAVLKEDRDPADTIQSGPLRILGDQEAAALFLLRTQVPIDCLLWTGTGNRSVDASDCSS